MALMWHEVLFLSGASRFQGAMFFEGVLCPKGILFGEEVLSLLALSFLSFSLAFAGGSSFGLVSCLRIAVKVRFASALSLSLAFTHS